MSSKIPIVVSDVLLHDKNSDRTEKVVLPITRYDNVMNSPTKIDTINNAKGAPFVLYQAETVSLTTEQIRSYVRDIL